MPHSCAHISSKRPACVGVNQKVVTLPGTMFMRARKGGTKKSCSTSLERSCSCTGRASGRCSSLSSTSTSPWPCASAGSRPKGLSALTWRMSLRPSWPSSPANR